MTLDRKYFPAWFRLDGRDRYLLWFDGGDDLDGVVTTGPGRVPAFPSVAAVRAFAAERGVPLSDEEPLLCDLDAAAAWLASPSAATVDCLCLGDAWNLFDDVASSIEDDGAAFRLADASESGATTWDRLFWGCNLPSVTPPGEHFVPEWDADEIATIADVLRLGFAMFRGAVVDGELGGR